MTKLINRLVCLIRGHKWKYYKPTQASNFFLHGWALFKCTRCGKEKEEWI